MARFHLESAPKTFFRKLGVISKPTSEEEMNPLLPNAAAKHPTTNYRPTMKLHRSSLPIVLGTACVFFTSFPSNASANTLNTILARVTDMYNRVRYTIPGASSNPYTGATNIITLIRDKAAETQTKVTQVLNAVDSSKSSLEAKLDAVVIDLQEIWRTEGPGSTVQDLMDQVSENRAQLDAVRIQAQSMLEDQYANLQNYNAEAFREELRTLADDLKRLLDAVTPGNQNLSSFVNLAVLDNAIESMPDVALYALDQALGAMPGMSTQDITLVVSDLGNLATAETCEQLAASPTDLEQAAKRVSQFAHLCSLMGMALEKIGESTSDLEFELGIHGYVSFSGKVNAIALIGGLFGTIGEAASTVADVTDGLIDGCEEEAFREAVLENQGVILQNQATLESHILGTH